VIPPHTDFTLERTAPPPWTVVDLSRAFARRCLDLTRLQTALDGMTEPAQELSLRAALELLSFEAHPLVRLRALGAAFAGLSGKEHGIKLRLDDVELLHGTTESSADVQRCALAPLPFSPELEQAASTLHQAEQVRLWLASDTQLPGAVAFVRPLSRETNVELTGPFALEHADALRTLFPQATVSADRLEERLHGFEPALPLGEEGALWNGRVLSAQAVLSKDRLTEGCWVFRFCTWESDVVLPSGEVYRSSELEDALARHGQVPGVRVLGEWWLGAPGVSQAQAIQTAERLGGHMPFAALAGIRPFHWHLHRPRTEFNQRPVAWLEPDPSRDLRRSWPFQAPFAQTPSLLETLLGHLGKQGPLAPGRLAGAYTTLAATVPVFSGVALDADCAIVTLTRALDGRTGPATYAANLRTGGVMAVDARLAPSLRALRRPKPWDEALPEVPRAQQEKILQVLIQKNILVKGGS